jgi:hypothetical protein
MVLRNIAPLQSVLRPFSSFSILILFHIFPQPLKNYSTQRSQVPSYLLLQLPSSNHTYPNSPDHIHPINPIQLRYKLIRAGPTLRIVGLRIPWRRVR